MKCKLKRTEAITTLKLLGWVPVRSYSAYNTHYATKSQRTVVQLQNGERLMWVTRYAAGVPVHVFGESVDTDDTWSVMSLAQLRRAVEELSK